MDATDRLIRTAQDYEVLAASHIERAPLGDEEEHRGAAAGFYIVAIALREVAHALLDEAA
jgi:hypothetical protein